MGISGVKKTSLRHRFKDDFLSQSFELFHVSPDGMIVLIQRKWHFSDLHRSRRRPVLLSNIPSLFPTDFSGIFEGRFSVFKPLRDMFRALQIV